MRRLWEVLLSEFNIIPHVVYGVLLVLFLVGNVSLFSLYRKKALRYVLLLLLVEYVFFVYGLTVFFRESNPNAPVFLGLFGTYTMFLNGMTSLAFEIIMNMALFIPIGFLWGSQTVHIKKLRWLWVFLFGIALSVGIEFLQMVYHKGIFQIEDIIHNVLGCLLGFLIWQCKAKRLYKNSCKNDL